MRQMLFLFFVAHIEARMRSERQVNTPCFTIGRREVQWKNITDKILGPSIDKTGNHSYFIYKKKNHERNGETAVDRKRPRQPAVSRN